MAQREYRTRSIDAIVATIKAMGLPIRQTGLRYWMAYCPVHENDGNSHNPSLRLWEDDNGNVAPTCLAGCNSKAVASAIDLYGDQPEQERHKPQITHIHDAKREQQATAELASLLWLFAAPMAEPHPYLVRKKVPWEPCNDFSLRVIDTKEAENVLGYGLRTEKNRLKGKLILVPLHRDDKMVSAEFIDEEGNKMALRGPGTKRGAYWQSSGMESPAWPEDVKTFAIGEGVATVLTVYYASQMPVVAAMSSVNIGLVAQRYRARYPDAQIVILADLEKKTGRPDQKAVKAAREIGAFLAIPDFGNDRQPAETDFNDMAQKSGLESVHSQVMTAQRLGNGTEESSNDRKTLAATMQTAFDIEEVKLKWLWPDLIPYSAITLIAGDSDVGKSKLLAYMASYISNGEPFEGQDNYREPGIVLYFSAEEALGSMTKPALMAAGGNLKNIIFIQGIKTGKDSHGNNIERDFIFPNDTDELERVINFVQQDRQINVAAIVIDPVTSYMGNIDTNNLTNIRTVYRSLHKLAEQYNLAVICTQHYGKNPFPSAKNRVLGSTAFTAFPRSVLGVIRDPLDTSRKRRYMMQTKFNHVPQPIGLPFTIESIDCQARNGETINTCRVEFTGEVEHRTIEEIEEEHRQTVLDGRAEREEHRQKDTLVKRMLTALEDATGWMSQQMLAKAVFKLEHVERKSSEFGQIRNNIRKLIATGLVDVGEDKNSRCYKLKSKTFDE